MMGANGILGAGAPLACGAGIAAKFRRNGGVGITFFGDGAANQGTVLESMNLAAIWDLPVVFVVENNGYAESTAVGYATAVDNFADRAAGFGVPGVTVDGTDLFAVYEAAGEMIKRARAGGGPSLLECKMIRFFGHFEGDAQTYKAPDENERNRATRDCIKLFAQRVTQAGVVSAAELSVVDREAESLIDEAVSSAKAAPLPTARDLLTDVYVAY
jgi:pyruvate dehydrogenase E1 component alpha subunit